MKKQHAFQKIEKYMLIIAFSILSLNLFANEKGCQADFDTNMLDGFAVEFINMSDVQNSEIFWDFGDGNFSYEQNPIHVYADSGAYFVCLQILNDTCSDMICKLVDLREASGSDDCDALYDFGTTEIEYEIQFNNLSIGNLDSLRWEFGDGSTSELLSPNHIFPSEGDYLSCLTIFSGNCTDIYCRQINVESMSCEAQFSYSSNEDRPSEIQFIDESDGNITKWEWDFGDVEQGGSFSDEQNPTHDFPANGSYEVNLSILTDNCAHDITKTIEIDVPLDIDFTFYLDSNNVVPNTFVFDAEINGYYDMLSWNFNNQTITDKEDTTHVYPEQDTDYQVCLTAIYTFNDTSEIKEVLCKGLTTSQYYNIGGQVFFGDSLMNNPYDTGDSAVAYLYRIDGPRMTLIDSNYFAYLGYYWFAQKLKAYYIIKTALFENATHFDDYAPTYVGNTTTWEEAEIINLAQNKYREDIHLVEKYTTKEGLSNLQGSIYDLMVSYKPSQQAVVCLYDMESNLVAYQYVDQYGDYYFESLNPGHYMLQADVTGIDARPKLIYLDTKEHQEYKSVKFQEQSELFPNPARHYSILNFDNVQNESALYISVYAVDGQLLGEENSPLSEGMNYLKINLDNYPNGVLILQISDGKQVISKKLFHQKL